MGRNNHRQSEGLGAVVRYLGVDVRPRSFGFIVMEDGVVLDSGVRFCDRPGFDDCLGQRFSRVLRIYRPSAVVVLAHREQPVNEKTKAIAHALTHVARQQGAAMVRINPEALRRYFRRHNARTKYEIAQAVARILPELAWQLPSKRRPWETEHRRMSVFEAAAAVITHAML